MYGEIRLVSCSFDLKGIIPSSDFNYKSFVGYNQGTELHELVFRTQLKLSMLYLYRNVMTPCYSTIIDHYPTCFLVVCIVKSL